MSFSEIAGQNLIESLGLSLLHSLWQISAIAATLFAILRILKNSSANLRYLVCLLALFLSFAVPAATFISSVSTRSLKNEPQPVQDRLSPSETRLKMESGRPDPVYAINGAADEKTGTETRLQSFRATLGQIEQELASATPYLVFLWWLGVLFSTARFCGGVWQVRRLRLHETRTVSNEWQTRFDVLCEKVGVTRGLGFVESRIADSPMVIGWIRPLVIVPSSVLMGCSPRELETIIVHELIHIRRYDYPVNVIQSFIEIVLFFHPLIWWISARVRHERENACDDAVVALFEGEHLLYANALANLEELRSRAKILTPSNAPAANGGNLMTRIKRIVKKNTEMRGARNSFWSASLAFLLISVVSLAVFSANSMPGVNAGEFRNAPSGKKIAIGFVGIPPVDRTANPPKDSDATARLLIAQLTKHKVPAVGFVNGGSISDGDKLFQMRANIVRLWRDAGLEVGLGNFRHVWFYDTPVNEYIAGVDKTEKIVDRLLAEKNLKPRYFSYPYLNTGKSLDDRNKFEAWLKERNLASVKYTFDNQEWMYSFAYDMARNDNDADKMKTVQREFIAYMSKMLDHYEAYSHQMFGRDISQTMVLTASRLVTDSSDELFGMFKARDYEFVSMEEAQKDTAYSTPENFFGKSGISWFERWQMAKGEKLLDEPAVDSDVLRGWEQNKPKN